MIPRDTIEISEGLLSARQQAKDKANPALRAKLEWIMHWQANEISRSILGRWDLGEEIDEVWRDLQNNEGRVYGRAARSTIALFMKEDPSIINVAHKLFLTYPNRQHLAEITQMVMQDGVTHLSYSHIRQLLTIHDQQRRHELMNECLEKCWTSAELGIRIQKENGGKTTNSPNGRGPSVPKDAETVIKQMISFADDFDNRNTKVWRDSRYSMPSLIDKIEPINYTEKLAKQLGELAHRLRQVATEANERAEEAEQKYEQVNRVVDAAPKSVRIKAKAA